MPPIEDEFLAPCTYCSAAITGIFSDRQRKGPMCLLHKLYVWQHVKLGRKLSPENFLRAPEFFLTVPLGRQTATMEQIEERIRRNWIYGNKIL